MRILLLANNWLGWQIAGWLRQRPEEIVGLVVHPPEKQKYGEEIIESVGLPFAHIFDGSKLSQASMVDAISELHADIAVSVLFGYILRASFIRLFRKGVINLHPGYLPYNRGVHPNVWSIVEGTPAGATLHYIDEGVDTGDIIAQKQVPVEPVDTGGTLYRKLEQACVDLFKETWPLILNSQATHFPQRAKSGTYHRDRDVERIDEIDLDRTYTARELIDIVRARTFPPHRGAYFRVGQRKVYLRLQLFYENDISAARNGRDD